MTAHGLRSRCAPFAFLAVLIGCSDLGPRNIVTGSWGGEAIGLVAEESEVRLDFLCLRAAVDGPFVVDSAGNFQDTARVTWRSFAGGDRDHRVLLRGEVQGSLMTLTVRHAVDEQVSDPLDYTLHRGVDPDFSGLGCLAASSTGP
jgi:hypothetical protein